MRPTETFGPIAEEDQRTGSNVGDLVVVLRAKKDDVIFWGEAPKEAIEEDARFDSKGKKKPVVDDLLEFVPDDGPILKDKLKNRAHSEGFSLNAIDRFVNHLLDEDKIFKWKKPRPGAPPPPPRSEQ